MPITYDSATRRDDLNIDPISGEPGSHPVGTGLGTIGGAAAGAAIGSVMGPVGTIVGALGGVIIGGIVGAYAGHDLAEYINPTEEDSYWRENHNEQPYAAGDDFETYRAAYRYGYESRADYPDRQFNEAEEALRQGWEQDAERNGLAWNKARDAVRLSYDRTGRLRAERVKTREDEPA